MSALMVDMTSSFLERQSRGTVPMTASRRYRLADGDLTTSRHRTSRCLFDCKSKAGAVYELTHESCRSRSHSLVAITG
jgi:hypothetical protein